ncbi:MAG: cytochrome c oxidase subunit I [Actinomycetota bacterium]|nr:cytochrome c oxidase subunit I [Actinomycetota bacterium]
MAIASDVDLVPGSGNKGIWSWITTVDHKRIGILYAVSAFVAFFVAGFEALLIRWQLATPNGTLLSADAYNQLFTMHGLTMLLIVVMPIGAAFMNYFIPLMIGARDVAFPRANAFSFWLFLMASLFLLSSFVLGGAPDGGWFGYAPLSTQLKEVVRMDYYAVGAQLLGVASIMSSANFIATIFTMRAPGMTLMRMPVFVWMSVVVTFLLIFSLPIFGVGLFQMFFDRNFDTQFFGGGGDPVLWQHLFWLFGHPEVYVLILPAMGIVSEILPVFSRKPLFGYPFVVFSGIAIGFMGFGVWAHHMFTSGLGPVAEAGFGMATMVIAVPTGVKIFNWIGTMWAGKVIFSVPMLFSIGFISMFVIGGLSGVTHAVVPSDYQQHDSYFVVAHFHYVLFGGGIFGYVAGVYYWFPKWTGRMLDRKLGLWHFWTMLIGFNLTFTPMHMLGLNGMARRTYRYDASTGWGFENMLATIGAFIIAASFLIFLWNLIKSRKHGSVAGNDPWDARTLEWSIPSPPPVHNFDEIPVVSQVDDFWHRKYATDEEGRAVRMDEVTGGALTVDKETGGDDHGGEHDDFHMPSPSYYPFVSAFGLVTMGYGFVYLPVGWVVVAFGGLITMWGLFGWSLEPVTKEPDHV